MTGKNIVIENNAEYLKRPKQADTIVRKVPDTDEKSQKLSGEGVKYLPVNKLVPFENHPFKLYDGERLDDMIASVKANGIIQPIIARPKNDDTYEIIAGHNRWNAAIKAGIPEVPVYVRDISDEKATVYAIESNMLQRSFSQFLPSEKMKVLVEHHHSLFSREKRISIRNELRKMGTTELGEAEEEAVPQAGAQDESQSKPNVRTDTLIGDEYGLGKSSVARYMKMWDLIDAAKEALDKDDMTLSVAYELAFLKPDEQKDVMKVEVNNNKILGVGAAKKLRRLSKNGELKFEIIYEIVAGDENPDLPPKLPTITYKLSDPAYEALAVKRNLGRKEIIKIIETAIKEYLERLDNQESAE